MNLPSYEQLYLELWELSCRFPDLVTFRVIGNSHDNRRIPMAAVGNGETVLYCVSGLEASDYRISIQFPGLIRTYCRAYEGNWSVHHFYQVKDLLQGGRLCIIPVLNPDGYEICRMGCTALRNPGYRQNLRSYGYTDYDSYNGNARGFRLNEWFLEKKHTVVENENRTIQTLLQEIPGKGLFYYGGSDGTKPTVLTYSGKPRSYGIGKKNRRLVRGLRHTQGEGVRPEILRNRGILPDGALETYYIEKTKEPACRIRVPEISGDSRSLFEASPLEGLFTLVQ